MLCQSPDLYPQAGLFHILTILSISVIFSHFLPLSDKYTFIQGTISLAPASPGWSRPDFRCSGDVTNHHHYHPLNQCSISLTLNTVSQLLCALISFVSLLFLRGALVFFITSASVARFLPPLRSIVVAPVLNCKKSSSRSQLWSLEMTAQWLLPSSIPSSSEISLKTLGKISSYPLLCEQTGYSSTCFSFFLFHLLLPPCLSQSKAFLIRS